MSSTQRKCWQKKRSHSFGLWWRPVQLHMPSVKLSIALKNCSLHVGLFGVSQIFANCFWMISQWVHSETISKHIDRSRQEFFQSAQNCNFGHLQIFFVPSFWSVFVLSTSRVSMLTRLTLFHYELIPASSALCCYDCIRRPFMKQTDLIERKLTLEKLSLTHIQHISFPSVTNVKN